MSVFSSVKDAHVGSKHVLLVSAYLPNDTNTIKQKRPEEQKRFWLAMYTYNPVEGEYFDDNPSGYLGMN